MPWPKHLGSLSPKEKFELMDSLQAVLTDCDGVLWDANAVLPGAREAVSELKKAGKRVFLITNNGHLTRSQYDRKCTKLGFDVEKEDIISSAWLVGQYLQQTNFNKKVYLVGSQAVHEELSELGIQCTGVGPDNFDPHVYNDLYTDQNFSGPDLDPDVGAVVVSDDFFLSYPKIMKAASYLSDPDTKFVATATDRTFPVGGGHFAPGAGVMVAAVETSSQRTPVVVGKPNTLVINEVLKKHGIEPGRCLMIGDRCDTDIYFGKNGGMKTLMVETGTHQLTDLKKFQEKGAVHMLPDYYTCSVLDLLPLIRMMQHKK